MPPPTGWREAVIRLAGQRGGELATLAEELEALDDSEPDSEPDPQPTEAED